MLNMQTNALESREVPLYRIKAQASGWHVTTSHLRTRHSTIRSYDALIRMTCGPLTMLFLRAAVAALIAVIVGGHGGVILIILIATLAVRNVTWL